MSNSAEMFSGLTIDPIAVKKTVYYRPAAADTVRVGDLVCYNWDETKDYRERSSNPVSTGDGGTAYAEGAQNYNIRLLVVEKPTEENCQFFAGVVARLGSLAGADNDQIEIFVPNGAVVPVMSDQNNVAGRTIVAVRDGVYEGSAPSGDGRPIGIAMETIDPSETDGLCWTKVDPNMFLWQYSNADALLLDDETDAWTRVNSIQVEYAGDQWVEVMNVKLEQLAGCTGTGLTLKAQLSIDKVTSGGYSTALEGTVEVGAGFGGTATAHGGFRAGTFKINVASGADLSDQYTACLYLEHYIHAGATGPITSSLIQVNATVGANAPDYFFHANDLLAVAFSHNVTHAEDAKVGAIKCFIGGGVGECYLWLYDGVS